MKTKPSVLGASGMLAITLLFMLPETALGQNEDFIKDASGIVTDQFTGLQWLVGPDRSMSWSDAEEWVISLGDGWRMPTRNDLQGLHIAGINADNWGPFRNSGWMIWTGEVQDSYSAWFVNFFDGSEDAFSRGEYIDYMRAFAVRTPNE